MPQPPNRKKGRGNRNPDSLRARRKALTDEVEGLNDQIKALDKILTGRLKTKPYVDYYNPSAQEFRPEQSDVEERMAAHVNPQHWDELKGIFPRLATVRERKAEGYIYELLNEISLDCLNLN